MLLLGPNWLADIPPEPDGHRDRAHPLDQELAVTLPLGPVAQQRLPLLEASVASRHRSALVTFSAIIAEQDTVTG